MGLTEAVQETQVRSLSREDPLEKEKATHPSILAWRIPWREEPGRLQSMASQRVAHDRNNSACTHAHGLYDLGSLPRDQIQARAVKVPSSLDHHGIPSSLSF